MDIDERMESMDWRTKKIRQLIEELRVTFEVEHPNLVHAMFIYGLAKKACYFVVGFALGYLYSLH